MSTLSVSMKLTAKQAGALYMKCCKLEDEVKALKAERDRLVAQVKDMSELCLTTGEVNEIKAEAGRAGYLQCKADFSEPHETWRINGETHIELADQYAASIRSTPL